MFFFLQKFVFPHNCKCSSTVRVISCKISKLKKKIQDISMLGLEKNYLGANHFQLMLRHKNKLCTPLQESVIILEKETT